jgi:hypothetical protein
MVVILLRLRSGDDHALASSGQAAAGAAIESNRFRNPWGKIVEVAICVRF